MNNDSSNLKLAKKRVTLKDIARVLDLSHATVSRALNGSSDPMISQKTIERVQSAAAELGYRPNRAARSLSTGQTGLIGLWLWTEVFQGSYHAAVSRMMHAEAMRRSRQLIVDCVARPSLLSSSERSFDSWSVDGIISHESGPAFETMYPNGNYPNVPIVSTGAYHWLEHVDQVRVNMIDGAEHAMIHLLAPGRRRILYVTDDLRSRQGDCRFQSYVRQMETAGNRLEFLETNGTRRGTRERLTDYIAKAGVPEGLFCHNDDMAIGAYRALCDLKLRVPEDVAIVGFDGIEDTEYLEVPLTTVSQPFEQLCSLATQFLDDRIEDPTRSLQQVELKAELIVRDSS